MGELWNFAYDSDGKRVRKTSGGNITTYYYNGKCAEWFGEKDRWKYRSGNYSTVCV